MILKQVYIGSMKQKNITTNKLQHDSMSPDFIYLADKIKIDVDRSVFRQPNERKH